MVAVTSRWCAARAGVSLRHVMELGCSPLCHMKVNPIVLARYKDAGLAYMKWYDTQMGIESSPDVVVSGLPEAGYAAFPVS